MAASAALFIALIAASPALAQTEVLELTCTSREAVVKFLGEKHGERVTVRGFIDEASLLEVFSTPDGATWTVVLTLASGRSCMVASGENWEKVSPKLLKSMGLPV